MEEILLKDIRRTANIWRESELSETKARCKWQDFVFYARPETWYDTFVINKLSDGISHKYFSRPMRDKTVATKRVLSVETGSKLLDELIELETLHIDAETRLSELMRVAWKELELPLKVIANSYGASQDATHKYIRRQEWFELRHEQEKVG